LLAQLERQPVAVASIGQVHRAVLEDGTPVAVKVRHPGIDAAIRADFKGAAIGRLMARAFAPGVDVAEIIEEAQARFLEECDYALEARHQARFVELFAAHESIAVPAVHLGWSGPRVLTTSWREGAALEAFLQSEPPTQARERAGRSLYEFYVGALYRHGLFNADPHPGNLLFSANGSVTILDHGCVREFDRETVAGLVRLSRAVRADDERRIQDALRAIGMPRPAADFDVTRGLLRAFFAPLLTPGRRAIPADRAVAIGETVKLKRQLLNMRLPGKLLFLFRIRFGLYAVLSRIGAELDWAALEDELAGLKDEGHRGRA
jgi:predicted unusual protein kinase regulating ubiquinone biosynthesis (AarF/ABC1/UbiB family)